jgi:hypothetical protein
VIENSAVTAVSESSNDDGFSERTHENSIAQQTAILGHVAVTGRVQGRNAGPRPSGIRRSFDGRRTLGWALTGVGCHASVTATAEGAD